MRSSPDISPRKVHKISTTLSVEASRAVRKTAALRGPIHDNRCNGLGNCYGYIRRSSKPLYCGAPGFQGCEKNSKASVGSFDYFFFPRGSSSTSRMKGCGVRQRRLIEVRCAVVVPLARDKAGSIIRKETIGLSRQSLFQAYQGCSVAVGARLIVMSEAPVSSSVVPRFLPKVTGSTSLENQ